MIYRAKSPRRGLEWGDLLILFNRNNCSLSVGVFSSSLICESIAVQFHNCVVKQQPHNLQFIRSARLFRLSPSPRSRHRLCCRTATSTIYTTFHYIHYISQRSNAKNCFRITGLQRQDSKPSADNNTRYSPSKSITECIKFIKRAELWTDFWQLNDIFEPPGANELIVWKTDSRFFSSRGSHALRT